MVATFATEVTEVINQSEMAFESFVPTGIEKVMH